MKRPRTMRLDGRTALITGAASGIGRALAVGLAARGCHLALADVNLEGLEETAAMAGSGTRVSRHALDVSDAGRIAVFPDAVRAAHPGLDILVNNAGVALGGTFEQVSPADFDWLIAINFFGVVRMTRAFLPVLRASDDARLVNLSSIFGIIAPPGQTAYAASKFAVRGFSEALRHELEGSSVGVTVVHPGGIATAIARNARPPAGASPAEMEEGLRWAEKKLRLSPDVAARRIIGAVERRRPRVLVGLDARFAAAAERLSPTGHMAILRRAVS